MAPSDPSRAPEGGAAADEGEAIDLSEPEDVSKALLDQLRTGSVVDGKYKVDSVIGRGAMGVVVEATHVHLGEKVALKFLYYRARADGADEDFQSRFRREAKVSAKLKNEHITRVIDVGVWKDRVPYMVMDFLAGGDLRQLVKGSGPLPVGTAIDYAVQVCTGIAEAHANGIVHRDLKPSNLFITHRPDGSELVKILDFGISKWADADLDELTKTGVVLGSPRYMSPEQLFGSSDVDARADVWSIGAILYEMLIGRPPFDLPTFTRICAELSTNNPPPSIVERRPEVSAELEAAVMRCFARNPDERTRDVAELAGSVLDAVGAPFSGAVRQKIGATLDRSTTSLSTSSGRMLPSGAYSAVTSGAYAAMSVTGSIGSSRSPLATPAPASTSAAALPPSTPEPARPSRLKPVVLTLAIVGAAAAVYLLAFQRSAGTQAAVTPPPVAVQAAVPPPAVTVAAPLAPSPSASSAAAAPEATVTAPRVAPHPVGRPVTAPPRPPPVAQAPAAAPPTPAPPPAPPPPVAPPQPKTDPLGDRQ